MLKRLMTATMAVAILAGAAVPAAAAACRDAHGKYVKCPAKKPTPARCKDAKGKFVSCSVPRAKHVK